MPFQHLCHVEIRRMPFVKELTDVGVGLVGLIVGIESEVRDFESGVLTDRSHQVPLAPSVALREHSNLGFSEELEKGLRVGKGETLQALNGCGILPFDPLRHGSIEPRFGLRKPGQSFNGFRATPD